MLLFCESGPRMIDPRGCAVRSTMICGNNLLEVRPAKAADSEPAFDWLGWDVLLSRKNSEVGGELLRLCDGVSAKNMNWRAINCLYAGWGKLLAASTSIAATDLTAWRRLWKHGEGDAAQPDPWPTAVFPEPGEMPANTYRTADSPVAFAASSGAEQLLGCDLDQLPAVRDNWLPLTFDRFTIQTSTVPEDSGPPEIPVAADGLFHGAVVDVNQTDLGDYLRKVEKTYPFAPEIVLHLTGSGERFTTPLRIKGSSVVLYFDPPPEKSEPLVLVPAGRGPAEALFDVEKGNLSIFNGTFRFSSAREARVVPWLIKLRGGDLRLFRTRLEVPPKDSGDAFRGLIALDGSGDPAVEGVRSCIANESILISAREGIAIQGIGARVQLTQSLLIAGNEAIRLALDPGFQGKANVQCLLDHVTVAARGAVLRLPDVKQAGSPAEPVVVQTHDCAFLNLFHRRGINASSHAGLVLYDGEALAHGLLVWQSENDAFDQRLWFAAAPASGPLPDRLVDHRSWVAVWGTPSLRRPQLYLPLVARSGCG